ncbi:MAG TPA: FAD-dependent oxidoreductase [Gaiellaceae bacterium]|nr:FAD-dependent oxidoreductase [Gaiellaceae bacterium]
MARRYDLVVAGAGMAGLVAAVQAAERGASVLVLEKGDRAGGSMRLSSGFVWRYREWERFRVECPAGDQDLQRLVWEGLDEDLAWLESLGAPVRERETANPLTVGLRFDPDGLTDLLVARAGEVRLGEPLRELPDGLPVVLATGGFQGDRELVRRHVTPEAVALVLRANPWSAGDGLRLGLAAGGVLSGGMNEFYGRNLPAPPARIVPGEFVGLAQLYAHLATVRSPTGEEYEARTWSEIDVVQWTARQPNARATYAVPDAALGQRVRNRTVAEMIARAEAVGGRVRRRDGVTEVCVVAGITTTTGGLRVDTSGRVAGRVFAAGADAGGVSTGGYSSGLAAALVLGRRAADAALDLA